MQQVTFSKESHSEWVLRNALYWITAHSKWNLAELESKWVVTFESDESSVKQEFDRLINDYILRERMARTEQAREAIISSVLDSISKKLAG